ncbi:hypothetical protein ACHAXA_007952 [Cyclostephanos tholiformis]|uniref:Potassium transporter n=1 Tax=Cyclostephanos tholiformis TaxID=382380 RepID=A0ABD3R553_9STRA
MTSTVTACSSSPTASDLRPPVWTKQSSRVAFTIAHRQQLSSLREEFLLEDNSQQRSKSVGERSLHLAVSTTSLPWREEEGNIGGVGGEKKGKAESFKNFVALLVGSVGVVFGDIGTSPLYTLNTVLNHIPIFEGDDLETVNRSEVVVAVYCLMFYTLVWVVLIKYVMWVMRVNHHGAGGELAMAQVILGSIDPVLPQGAAPYPIPRHRSSSSTQEEMVAEEKMKNNNDDTNSTPTFTPTNRRQSHTVMTLAIISTSFLIGDGVITPPNTVLGALYSPVLENISTGLNVFISAMVLILIFNVQRYGSKAIGLVNGPIMILWFATLAFLGLLSIVRYPEEARFLARAFNPASLTAFSGTAGKILPIVGFKNAFLCLGSVILCVTGGEALYADLGHFGYRAIMAAWCTVAFPALAIQYYGQCCYVISLGRDITRYPPSDHETEEYQALVQERNLFNTQLITVPGNLVYALAPTESMSYASGQACLWLLTILAVLASIIASQALISGVFSILTQACALDLAPRMNILHTNPNEKGQVFISEANTMMCTACVLIVLIFETSDKLTAAYGIAVAFCMTITDILMIFVMCWVWKFHWIVAIIVALPFVFVDGLFLSSNCLKLALGLHSWVSIIIAVVAWFSLYSHWWSKTHVKEVAHLKLQGGGGERGVYDGDDVAPVQSDLLSTGSMMTAMDVDNLLRLLKESKMLKRMPVAGVFLTPYRKTFPLCLSTLARSMAALPETIILLHLSFSRDKPFVDKRERYDLHCHSEELGVYSLNMYFGYCEPITADHFDVNNSLREIFQAEGYVALQKLAEVQREPTLLMPFHESQDELSLFSRDSHWTYFLGVRKYIPHAKENIFAKLLVYICDFLTRNSKSAIDFFGLSSIDTIEVNCTTIIQSKDHSSGTKETLGESELSEVELAKKEAGEYYEKNE